MKLRDQYGLWFFERTLKARALTAAGVLGLCVVVVLIWVVER